MYRPLPPTTIEPLRYSVREAAQMLRLAQSTMWKRISRGDIRVVRDGGRTLIPADELRRYSALDREAS